jgi:hypothetical protein
MSTSATISPCSCISLSATSESFGGVFKTTLKPGGYVNGRKSYVGYDPCCGQNLEIKIVYDLVDSQWEIFYDNNLISYISGGLQCPTGTTWADLDAVMDVFETAAITCPQPRKYDQLNYLQSNECGVLTIYPMGAICEPTSPIVSGGYGSLGIKITGGTPPYQVILLDDEGNTIRSIPPLNSSSTNFTNLESGTYFVQITDQFGDFTLLINCTIVEPTTTTTTTLAQLPSTPSFMEYNMCITIQAPKTLIQIPFIIAYFETNNGVIHPVWKSPSGNELIYWNQSWILSGSPSSQLVTQFNPPIDIVSTYPLPIAPNTFNAGNVPLSNWFVSNVNSYPSYTITAIRNICSEPTLNFIINEGWWQTWNANIPNQYRGSSCGGQNLIPNFVWNTYNLPVGVSVISFDILCINMSTLDVYLDVTNISPSQLSINSSSLWIGGATINNTIGGPGLMNSQGWEGPCSPTNYSITLTANLSSGPPLINTIYFIYCTTTINGICGI